MDESIDSGLVISNSVQFIISIILFIFIFKYSYILITKTLFLL
jgi:hypothetical protein